MKTIYKIFFPFVLIIIINIVTQTPSYSHPLQSFLSTISFFSNANASDHTAEKEVIKELKIKIYNLGAEPLKRKGLFQSDKKWIVDLKKQIKDLEKQNSINKLQSKIEKEIEELDGKPITKVTEIDRDDQIIALKKQLENLKIIKAEKEEAIKLKNAKKEEAIKLKNAKKEKVKDDQLKSLKKEVEDKIIALGAEPITKKNTLPVDEVLKGLQNQLTELENLQDKDKQEENRQVLKKQIENQIIELGAEPITKEKKFANDDEISALRNQLEETKKIKLKTIQDKIKELKIALEKKEKKERLDILKEEIESEIILLGAKPVTENSEFANDENVIALEKQLQQLRIDAENKENADNLESDRQKVIAEIQQNILELGETPISEYLVNNEDEFINVLNKQLEKIKSIKEQEEKEIQESVPNWFIMMPKANEKVIYVRGTAVVDTMQGSIDTATNAALRDLAKKLETRLAAKVNETVIQAGIGEDITTKSEIIKVTTLVVEEVTIIGYEISKNKIFKMNNGKYRTFILLEYPVANLYKAFINRLENNKAMQKQLDQIKNTETYKELEAYVIEFTGA
ncbi:hypothetical protein N9O89_00295 [Candidatus Pelagibacter sp.]|nr:hypothetical protein [Candidatus Pelagibacter sp.]